MDTFRVIQLAAEMVVTINVKMMRTVQTTDRNSNSNSQVTYRLQWDSHIFSVVPSIEQESSEWDPGDQGSPGLRRKLELFRRCQTAREGNSGRRLSDERSGIISLPPVNL